MTKKLDYNPKRADEMSFFELDLGRRSYLYEAMAYEAEKHGYRSAEDIADLKDRAIRLRRLSEAWL